MSSIIVPRRTGIAKGNRATNLFQMLTNQVYDQVMGVYLTKLFNPVVGEQLIDTGEIAKLAFHSIHTDILAHMDVISNVSGSLR